VIPVRSVVEKDLYHGGHRDHRENLMRPTRTPRVKICCITSIDEAAWAIECGASALGLVSHMPSGPGVISDELIAEIAATVPPAIGTFLLTSRQSVAEIIEQQRFCRTNTVQLCDHLTHGTYRELKDSLPGISLVQVIHVTGPESVEEAARVAPHVDAILLDSGNQKLAIKELGGTGRTHDWTLSRAIRERIDIPLFLAGGLTPENVEQAIDEVGPFGLDLCSGVRTDGKLDASKLKRFFAAARSARA
jgi:phosphoribosylanthranilate isomerase